MRKKLGWVKVLMFLSISALVSHWIHIISVWTDIPDRIAIHFTNDEPDHWGSKYVLLVMPVIALLVWWLLGKLTKHPEKFNYIHLTDKNRNKQYKMAGNMMAIIQNLALLLFIFANEAFLRSAIRTDDDIFFILSIVSLVLMLLVILYNVIWAARLKD